MKLHGPLKNRRCTDFLFTVLFLAFAGACGYVVVQGTTNGDPNKLLSPVDYDGKLCGVDYPNHPFLYFLVQLANPTAFSDGEIEYKALCISSCPPLNTTEPIDCKLINGLVEADCSHR